MKKLLVLFAFGFLGLNAVAPARVAPDTTVTVRVVYLNTAVWPPRIDRAVGAGVKLTNLFFGLVRHNYSGFTNNVGEITFLEWYPPINPTSMIMSASATFGTLQGQVAQPTALPTNPWLLTIVVQ